LRQPARAQVVRQALDTLELRVRVAAEERPVDRVASIPQHEVDVHTVGRRFRRAVPEIDRHFLGAGGIGDEHAAAPLVGFEPIEQRFRVAHPAAVHLQLDVGLTLAAAHVLGVAGSHRDPRGERGKCLQRLVGRDRIERLPCDLPPRRGVLHVHHGALPRNGDGLLERSDAQIGVDGGSEAGRQLDTFTLERAEGGERERHRVNARRQPDDPVLPFSVGDGAADLLDERRTRRLDGDAREHRSGGISYSAGDAARTLCERG